MDVGVVFGFALAGYLFLSRFLLTRDRLAHRSGYEMLFVSAACGLILTLLTTVSVQLLKEQTASEAVHGLVTDYNLAVLSVLLGWLGAHGLNKLPWMHTWRRRTLRRLATARGDLIELLLDDALQGGWHVELTLRTGKSYVGLPMGTTEPGVGDEGAIEIIPLFSGYRSEEKLELKLTRYYGTDIALLVRGPANHRAGVAERDFRVLIPIREVATARLFDPDIFRHFNRDTNDSSRTNADRGRGSPADRFEALVPLRHDHDAQAPISKEEQSRHHG